MRKIGIVLSALCVVIMLINTANAGIILRDSLFTDFEDRQIPDWMKKAGYVRFSDEANNTYLNYSGTGAFTTTIGNFINSSYSHIRISPLYITTNYDIWAIEWNMKIGLEKMTGLWSPINKICVVLYPYGNLTNQTISYNPCGYVYIELRWSWNIDNNGLLHYHIVVSIHSYNTEGYRFNYAIYIRDKTEDGYGGYDCERMVHRFILNLRINSTKINQTYYPLLNVTLQPIQPFKEHERHFITPLKPTWVGKQILDPKTFKSMVLFIYATSTSGQSITSLGYLDNVTMNLYEGIPEIHDGGGGGGGTGGSGGTGGKTIWDTLKDWWWLILLLILIATASIIYYYYRRKKYAEIY